MQNTFVYAIAYALTHHYTLFAILAYALANGVPNLFIALVPILMIMGLVALAHVVYYLFGFNSSITRYPMFCSMNAMQLSTLGFVYAFGYFAPTVYLIQHARSQS